MACAINLGSTVAITGGQYTKTRVSEYSQEGWVRDLPSLQQGRYEHGCSYYEDGEGRKVNIDYDADLPQKYNVKNIPTSIVTDMNGNEIKRHVGAFDGITAIKNWYNG